MAFLLNSLYIYVDNFVCESMKLHTPHQQNSSPWGHHSLTGRRGCYTVLWNLISQVSFKTKKLSICLKQGQQMLATRKSRELLKLCELHDTDIFLESEHSFHHILRRVYDPRKSLGPLSNVLNSIAHAKKKNDFLKKQSLFKPLILQRSQSSWDHLAKKPYLPSFLFYR